MNAIVYPAGGPTPADLLSGAIFTGPVDTTQTTLTIAPATAAGHAVQLGQFTSNLPALLRTRGYYGLLDNYNMTRLPTNGAAPITVGTTPYGVAYCPTNDRIYVVNYSAASVSVIIPATGVVTATITVGTNPMGVAYCPTNDRIYVSNAGSASVSVIIPATGVVTATITVGTSPYCIAYCPTNDRIYVANYGAASVSVIIPATGVVTATITVGASPYGVAYCPTNDRIYVINSGSASVSVLT